MTTEQLNYLIFVVVLFGLAGGVIGYVLIALLQQIRDLLNTSLMRESERRGWTSKGHH